MASANVRNIVLSQTSAFNSKKQELTVTQVGERYKRDPETKQATKEIEGYMVNVLTPRTGEVQTVKLPLTVKEQFTTIKTALAEEKVVIISFNGTFKAKFWAMKGDDNRINMGLSATATELSIISIEDLHDEFMDDDIVL